MKTHFCLFLTLLFISAQLHGQSRFLRRGNKAFERKEYPKAIVNFSQIKEKNPQINRKIALAYFYQGRYDQAESYYQKIYDSEKTTDDLLQLSMISLSRSDYSGAIHLLEQAKSLDANASEIDDRIAAINEIASGKTQESNIILKQIAQQPNGKSLGILYHNGGLIFSKAKKGKQKGVEIHQFYYTGRTNGAFADIKPFDKELVPNNNIGAACFSPDGKEMYFTSWYTRKGRQMMEILVAHKKNGKWKLKGSLPFNSKRYSCAYPFLADKGKQLYFSSDMDGGEGGMDLYMCYKRGNAWSDPINLGNKINTSQNEIYPAVLNNNQFWFASDGHIGYGKLDLFYTQKTTSGEWGKVQNAGKVYNSSENDFSITADESSKLRFLVSDREERGLKDRIYELITDEKIDILLTLKDDQSLETISDARVQVKKIISDQLIADLSSAKDNGQYAFPVSEYDMGKGILHEIKTNKDGYEDVLHRYYPEVDKKFIEILLKRKVTEGGFVEELIRIDYPNKKVAFENVNFGKQSLSLSEKARKTLDRFYSFWKLFPDLKVQLNSHTDTKGSAVLNMSLSRKRGQLVKEYLIARGMKEGQISVNAFGEQFPINECTEGEDCPESKHMENRRVELIFGF